MEHVLHFTRRERQGIVFFLLLCAVFIFYEKLPLPVFLQKEDNQQAEKAGIQSPQFDQDKSGEKAPAKRFRFDPNSASEAEFRQLGISAKVAGTILKYRKAGGRFKTGQDLRKIYSLPPALAKELIPWVAIKGQRDIKAPKKDHFKTISRQHFDPNTAVESLLAQNGIPAKTIRTLLKYRAAGGRFRKAEDLKKLYGLPQSLYQELLPFVQIESSQQSDLYSQQGSKDAQRHDHKTRQVLDINTADAYALRRLPGMHSAQAARILKFRDKLGGFHSVAQVAETHELPDSVFKILAPWLRVGQMPQKIKINQVSAEELAAHPYIRFKEARILVNYRSQHGDLKGVSDLERIGAFSPAFRQRILPYLDWQPAPTAEIAASSGTSD